MTTGLNNGNPMKEKSDTMIRVSRRLRTKLRRAALLHDVSMADYLDSIVPEIRMEEE